MNITQKVFKCDSLVEQAVLINNFVKKAKESKQRKSLVENIYTELSMRSVLFYTFSQDSFFIADPETSVNIYTNLMGPKYESPVKTLNKLNAYAEEMLKTFSEPHGAVIAKNDLEKIMDFLDTTYDFSEKVFSDETATFSIVNNSHVDHNSECLIYQDKQGNNRYHFFLYAMKSVDTKEANPIAVLFHELGHALHARYTGSTNVLPPNIAEFLNNTFFPGFKDFSPDEAAEVLADVFSMGLMYGSPFEEFDLFWQIEKGSKQAFNTLVKIAFNDLR